MVAVPIIEGVYADNKGRFRTALPVNYSPVVQPQGISNGFLKPGDGLVEISQGLGTCRGSTVWKNKLYAVMGVFLCLILPTGEAVNLGEIGGSGRVTMTHSFSHLAIASSEKLWLYSGSILARVTDPDLNKVLDVTWVDGYFMTTDGSNLVVTQLNNPFAVSPLKYGSSEVDPDPIVGIVKIRNEIYAINRNTIEVFQNIGGALFPFVRVNGGQIMRGAISADLACMFEEAVAFVGGAANDPPSVYMGRNGSSQRIASREIDTILQGYTNAELKDAWLDTKTSRATSQLYLHMPDQTLVYDATASAGAGTPIWFILKSNAGSWRVASQSWAYGQNWAFDTVTNAIGKTVENVSTHWGQQIDWEITTPIIFNATNGGAVDSLELTTIPDKRTFGVLPQITEQSSSDGVTFTAGKPITIAAGGKRTKRIAWFRCGPIDQYRIERFTGTSDAHLPIAALEAVIRPSQW